MKSRLLALGVALLMLMPAAALADGTEVSPFDQVSPGIALAHLPTSEYAGHASGTTVDASALSGALGARAASSVEAGQVSGPIPSGPVGDPSHNYPFFSARQDLASYGYTEQEFFFSGTTISGPYTSRMLVRRPTSAARFSGNVFVEWVNVTSGYDIDALWVRSADQILRNGDAYIAVDAQTGGVYTPNTGLKAFSPTRYERLHIPRIGVFIFEPGAYGIFAQALQTIRHPRGANPLGGLRLKTVVATGTSQAAGALLVYSSTLGVAFPRLVDAYLITALSTGTVGAALGTLGLPPIPLLSASFPYIVTTQGVPVFVLNTETDPSFLRLPDTTTFRTWEVAGSSHADYDASLQVDGLARRDLNVDAPADPGCDAPALSRIPFRYAQNAALLHITRWARTGTPPPSQPGFLYTFTGTIVRDGDGDALGGVRLPEQDVPTATNRGDNSGPGLCGLLGQHIPFTPDRLRALYADHASYVRQVRAAAQRAVTAGVLLPADASEVIATADAANIPPQ